MKPQTPADDSASPISPTAYRPRAIRTAASAPQNRAARSILIHHAYKVYRLQSSTCRRPARFGIKRQRYKCLLSKMAARSVPGPYGRPRLNEPGQPISRIGSPSHCAATDQLEVERPPARNGALFPAPVRAAQNPRLHCRKDTVQFPVLNTESCPESCPSGRRSTIGNRVGAKSVSRVQIPDSPPVAFSRRALFLDGAPFTPCGGVAEWLNAAVSKTVYPVSPGTRVRIPPPPPVSFSKTKLLIAPTLLSA